MIAFAPFTLRLGSRLESARFEITSVISGIPF